MSLLEEELARSPGRVLCWLKVGKRDHMNLLAEGHLRFRDIAFFSAIEAREKPFYDEDEGVSALLHVDRTRIRISCADLVADVRKKTGLVERVRVRESRQRMVFCMHAIHSGTWTHREFSDEDIPALQRDLAIPETMSKFGDSVWFIKDRPAFTERLRRAVKRENLGLKAQLVRYTNLESVHGRVPEDLRGFVKHATFADEREYRFVIDDAPARLEDPYVLKLGDLRDISVVAPFDEFRRALTFTFSQAA